MRRVLLFVLVGLVAFALGWVVKGGREKSSEAKPATAPLTPGSAITVVRPTGETVTMRDGKNPVPKTETTRLVVYRTQGGEHHAPPAGAPVWQLVIGSATVYAVPE